MITNITIKNVKGFDVTGKSIDLTLNPKKVNLCVAPNGFGKSSLAVAFESLKRTRLDVDIKEKNINHQTEDSSLSVVIDGVEYTANGTKNDVSSQLECFVIHNRIHASCTKNRIQGFTAVKAYNEITKIQVCKVCPTCNFTYSISDIKRNFGNNGKILVPVNETFENRIFCLKLQDIMDLLKRFINLVRKQALIGRTVTAINAENGTKEQIKERLLNGSLLDVLNEDEDYNHFLEIYRTVFGNDNKYDCFNLFYQLLEFCKNREQIKCLKILYNRALYDDSKEKLDADLELLDTTGRAIRSVEESGNLFVKFPHADQISNGQRDVLTFATELMIFKSKIRSDRKYLLIIDEVFDYLDDANTLAAQYYLSKIVNRHTEVAVNRENLKNVYVMLLTHLNPYYFRNYVFNDKLINILYLENTEPVSTDQMKAFIAFREGLNVKTNTTDKALYDRLSCDIFHYNPNGVDHSQEIERYHKRNVKSTWGDPSTFKQVLIDELNKYLRRDDSYDPYAVAMSLRLKVEKNMYEKLETEELKNSFIETHKTNNKLNFCENHQITVPDTYYIVNAIHNSADHLKKNSSGEFEEKQMVYKLQNKVVRNIIEHLFDYVRNDLTVDVI